MKYVFSLVLVTMLLSSTINAQISVPATKDDYAAFVEKLEKGETDIDYTAFRISFINSKQYGDEFSHLKNISALQSSLRKLEPKKQNADQAVSICQKILSIDYTNLLAQSTIYQAYAYLADSVNMNKHLAITNGLVRSITSNGNGRTRKTAFNVVKVEEEYFILQMMHAQLKSQGLDMNGKHSYDMMTVELPDEGERNIYFNIDLIIKQRRNSYQK